MTQKKLVAVLLIILMQSIFIPPTKVFAATRVDLLTSDGFAVLAGSGITNTGATTITGDVGSFPTTTQTGFAFVTLNGTNQMGNAVTQQAKTDLTTAYLDAEGRTSTSSVTANLGGQTLTPGVYRDNDDPDSLALTGNLTLDAQGDANAVFIFQSGSTLVTAAASSVTLINGAQACNVFWQVGSSATLGTTTDFKGTILALTSITLNTGATVNGRALARNGAVTMDSNTITKSTCAAGTTGGPVTSTSSSSSSNSSGSSSTVCVDLPPTNNPNLFQIDRVGSTAKLYFTPVNDYLGYYYIAYGLNPGSEQFGVSFPAIHSSGALNFTISNLDPNTTYYFKIRGGNGCAPGGWSNNMMSDAKNPRLPNTGFGSSND